MTRYEDLIEKSERCIRASLKTEGFMAWVWMQKATELQTLANNLPLVRANQIIGESND